MDVGWPRPAGGRLEDVRLIPGVEPFHDLAIARFQQHAVGDHRGPLDRRVMVVGFARIAAARGPRGLDAVGEFVSLVLERAIEKYAELVLRRDLTGQP